MPGAFESARELLRASIADCFGYPITVTTAEGDPREINGYIRESKEENHTIYRLISDSSLPEGCTLTHKGRRYFLTYEAPLRDSGSDSQIAREYTMALVAEGKSDGWSEY
ncbi:hypothetical protein L3Q72_06675 [Vibrio sp. JC009]|uniref:hypothetical protein n=1 Tax=Vibrio sp. JC009 TaxID=2912314 RepID=UPI0023AF2D99|nr:hypothetical protein [Vibrio sp. JC009]WED23072.1 hypothetical protein L3Q72_06675 [Vibrio sp. JC009]